MTIPYGIYMLDSLFSNTPFDRCISASYILLDTVEALHLLLLRLKRVLLPSLDIRVRNQV